MNFNKAAGQKTSHESRYKRSKDDIASLILSSSGRLSHFHLVTQKKAQLHICYTLFLADLSTFRSTLADYSIPKILSLIKCV